MVIETIEFNARDIPCIKQADYDWFKANVKDWNHFWNSFTPSVSFSFSRKTIEVKTPRVSGFVYSKGDVIIEIVKIGDEYKHRYGFQPIHTDKHDTKRYWFASRQSLQKAMADGVHRVYHLVINEGAEATA